MKLKKHFAWLLVAVMSFSCICPAFAEEEAPAEEYIDASAVNEDLIEATDSDASNKTEVPAATAAPVPTAQPATLQKEDKRISLEETGVQTECGLLSGLEIISENELEKVLENKLITRGEFAQLTYGLLGLKNTGIEVREQVRFIDVLETNEYYDAVVCLAEVGLVSGYENYRFYPNDKMQYQDAAALIVSALGYREVAMAEGGFPKGFLNYAARLRLAEGVKTSDTGTISYENAIRLIYNALSAETMKMTYCGETVMRSGETLLSGFYKTQRIDGIIDADRYTGLYDPSERLPEGNARVNGENYLDYNGILADSLGMRMRVYVRDSGKELQEAVYAEPYKNKKLVLESADIDDFRDGQYNYGVKGKAKLSDDFTLIYNNRASVSAYYYEKYVPKSGNVTLIDNDLDGDYEVVKIREYIYRVVSKATQDNEILSFKKADNTDDFRILNFDEFDVCEKYDFNGAVINSMGLFTESYTAAMLISEETDGKRMGQIFFSVPVYRQRAVTGTVSSLSEVDGRKSLIIKESVSEEQTKYLVDLNESNHYQLNKLKAGASGTFYLTMDGSAVWGFNPASSGNNIGYLIQWTAADRSEFEQSSFKILQTDGQIVTYNPAGKLQLQYPDPANPDKHKIAGISDTSDLSKLINRGRVDEVVIYDIDADRRLKRLTMPVIRNRGADFSETHSYKGDGLYAMMDNPASYIYVSKMGVAVEQWGAKKTPDMVIPVSNSAIAFFVPDPEKKDEYSDYESYSCGTIVNGVQTMKAYCTDGTGIGDVIVCRKNYEEILPESTPCAVESVAMVYDEESEEIMREYTLYSGSSKVLVRAYDDAKFDPIGTGDIIQYSTMAGKMQNFHILVDYNEQICAPRLSEYIGSTDGILFDNTKSITNKTYWVTLPRYVFGMVFDNKGTFADVVIPEELDTEKSTIEPISLDNPGTLLVFDENQNRWRTGTKADIFDYIGMGRSAEDTSWVFTRQSYGGFSHTFVYNNRR